jgi:SNF2 family DNA or RNA helicase
MIIADTPDVGTLRRLAEKELGVPARLHDYQWEGVAFLLRSNAALLADEMGLGKTVQAAVAIALLHGQHVISRAMIVAPASLTLNWISEIATWAPSLTLRRVVGDASNREACYLLPIPVIVASYEQIRLDALDRIPAGTFDLVVLDEAQRIKNQDSATAFSCRLLPRRRAWALSATPLENDASDVSSILRFLMPSSDAACSASHMRAELEQRMLRRRKTDVRAELPSVLIQDLPLDLSAHQRHAYDALWFDRASTVRHRDTDDPGTVLLALITRLKILCNLDAASGTSSKLDALRAFIEEAGERARILVFSQFVGTLRWVARRLGRSCGFITGSMPMPARYDEITRFKCDAPPRVLLISLRAGGVGLNLGDATHVVLFDRWWNPAVEIQAIYRAHRFDRDTPLHVVRFLVQDTIEERITEILHRKARLFEEVVESVDTADYHFSRDELLRILELSPGDLTRVPNSVDGVESKDQKGAQ